MGAVFEATGSYAIGLLLLCLTALAWATATCASPGDATTRSDRSRRSSTRRHRHGSDAVTGSAVRTTRARILA